MQGNGMYAKHWMVNRVNRKGEKSHKIQEKRKRGKRHAAQSKVQSTCLESSRHFHCPLRPNFAMTGGCNISSQVLLHGHF